MLPVVQPIKATTEDGKVIKALLLKEDGVFSVLMEDTPLPAGTVFSTADEAVRVCIKALNGFLSKGSQIANLYSQPIEEYISNEEMNRLLHS